ncbi:MAG TPA: cytochrome c-type biogenesis protein, partial [Usitatibacter sp.]|nr:cytochrome c-type biogenesis protein [Usitatibacter sp.]
MLALASTWAFGQADEVAHPDPVVEQRLKDLAEELRCLVCQNQTIADSTAPLALDLRNQIRAQVAQGRTDDEIRAYMVARYGDFVLYRPPLKATTVMLWLG